MTEYTVEQARMLSKISQQKMSEILEISKNSYINKENGTSRFYVDEALKFSKAVGIPFDKIKFVI